jgi:hypothetical protein
MEHRILDNGINTADLERQWEKLLIIAYATNPTLANNMNRGIFSWDNPGDHAAVKIKLIALIAEM